MKLRSIDLFTGIGGLSLSLKQYTTPLLYCEIDKFCQKVLTERMREDRLDPAPIHTDITTLHLSEGSEPVMLVGGFPCQDISSIGLKMGISGGQRSGMFYEIMRLVDSAPSIKVLFLENVANISKCGMKEVIEECTAREFDIQWLVKSAASLGAPHMRKRWFCLAVKRGYELPIDIQDKEVCNNWNNEPHKRITFKPSVRDDPDYDVNWTYRCQTLGNAVVPHVARHAFEVLVSQHKNWPMYKTCLSVFASDASDMDYPYPENGIILDGKLYELPRVRTADIQHKVDIHILNSSNENVKMVNFPTPRRGNTHAATVTPRTLHDLPTVLINSNKAREYIESLGVDIPEKVHSIAVPNVQYIEWMMGYDKDWTKVTGAYYGKSATGFESTSVSNRVDGSEDGESSTSTTNEANRKPKRLPRLNGMHVFMREHSNKDVRKIAQLWKELDEEKRQVYSRQAKQLNNRS